MYTGVKSTTGPVGLAMTRGSRGSSGLYLL
jgi:hypothetical protein